MTPELLSLRKKMDHAKGVYDGTQMTNVTGRTSEELVKLDIETHRAKQSWLTAYSEYQKALEVFVKN